MKIQPIRTHLIQIHEPLTEILNEYLPKLEEKSVVAITSKIVSVSEGRVLNKTIPKQELIRRESDLYLKELNEHGVLLTIKNHILIPNAGIDESNGDDVYILYPEDVFLSAANIWRFLKERDGLDHLGVIITDSHTSPMRWGVTGIGIGWCGFAPLNNYIGTPDCYGHHLKFTKVNVVDALSVAAVFTMGEGNEQTPMALLTDLDQVSFSDKPPTKNEIESLYIPMDQDLYGPLLTKGTWLK
jgi:putative folate metabolism gamma-glutamate ligase